MSSVQGHGKIRKSGLVDESRKAKKYAAQFVGYIIQAFCRYQLACPIAPATRDAVMPGLFAVLDIMDPSAKQALNAILDGPARSIWKSLYGEWKMATQWRES